MTLPARILTFVLTLETDAIFSTSAATQGGHFAQPFIPGNVLRGAAARDYPAFQALAQDIAVFQSGAVRFGNGYPLPDKQPTLPVPLSWAREKGAESGAPIHDRSAPDHNKDLRLEGVQRPFVTHRLSLVDPTWRQRAKTAIDRSLFGQSRDGALFAYTSLQRGQKFLSRIHLASTVTADAADQLIKTLTGSPLRIGRSRKAEYGRASAVLLTESDSVAEAAAAVAKSGDLVGQGRVVILALSDLVPTDPGLPTANVFGLPDRFSFDPEHSFVRHRRYVPFNTYRQLFETERHLLVRGSVFSFKAEKPLDRDEADRAEAVLAAGVGRHRVEGFGAVAANSWVVNSKNGLLQPVPLSAVRRSDANRPQDRLATWLTGRHADRLLPRITETYVEEAEEELKGLYQQVRREAALEGQSLGEAAPTRAQWGTLLDLASTQSKRAALYERLFREDPKRKTAATEKTEILHDQPGGFFTSGVGSAKWRRSMKPSPNQPERSFADLIEARLKEARLGVALAPLGKADDPAWRDRLAVSFVQRLAQRMPRVLAELTGERQP